LATNEDDLMLDKGIVDDDSVDWQRTCLLVTCSWTTEIV
jgi:hypothetical protein